MVAVRDKQQDEGVSSRTRGKIEVPVDNQVNTLTLH